MPKTTVKHNNMSFEEALNELTTLEGLRISDFSGKPEIILTSKLVQALEIARWSLSQPERQDTICEAYGNSSSVELNGQCASCGMPVATSDQYCSGCGRYFKEVYDGSSKR